MLKSLAKAHLARRTVHFLPGGWVTMVALSPTGRRIGYAAARHGWKQVQKRRTR